MDEWTVPDAKDVIRISLVPPTSFPSSKTPQTFNPSMTYQLFENDAIYGYKNLSVDLKFRQDDMSPSLTVKYDEKLSAAGASTDNDSESKVDEVEEVLQEYLPKDIPADLDLTPSTFKPPGKLVNTYTRESANYEIYHSDLANLETRSLIHRMQILVLFFIEAGSVIDREEENEDWLRNRWDVFLLYERLPGDKYSFVGYCTVHKYWYFSVGNKGEKEEAKEGGSEENQGNKIFPQEYRARISQFLILPPFQKKGHAKDLYNVIIQEFLATKDVKEITVEDPSERFEELRDVADFHRLKKISLVSKDVPEMLLQRKNVKGWIDTQRAAAKMPQRQFMRIVELLLLEHISLLPKGEQADQLAKYMPYVKERLYRHNKDILMQLERDERSEKLQETYMNVHDGYLRLLKKMGATFVAGEQTAPIAKKVISGKRPAANISTIAESGDEEEEEEEELEPVSKKVKTRK
ncbi:hypothetical protein ABW20_dc0100828 [Dactylellina cionopaga]|nr:hypothetical protein ABW20_dc0100828 [Dactylellina cionopaga]